MNVIETALAGVLIIEPRVFDDGRGFFQETWHADRYAALNLPVFVQDNHSRSSLGVLRGLHAQRLRPQGKLVLVTRGAVFDVVADINPASPTFGQSVGIELNDTNHRQLYVPPGYVHGFCVLSETVDFLYKCTDYYQPNDEIGVVWNDPDLAIDWPRQNPLLSAKDAALPTLAALTAQQRAAP